MNPVERYLAELALMRRAGAGVDELSGYPALKSLLDEVGGKTKPKVRTIMNLRNLGAGLPDGGLFTAGQFTAKAATQPKDPSRPDVAAIEVKGTAADINAVIASEQVNGYLTRYGQVLVTNYRQFVLMVERDGSARKADEFSLADTDAAFWSDVAGRPRAWATERGERFHEFLTRVLRSRSRLTEPSDVAWMLASHARDAMEILGERKLRALETIRTSFEEALGITFEGEQGDHFFRSSLVQTLFYGIFSGWVLWSRQNRAPDAVFDWKDAGWTLHVPMISALFDQVANKRVLGNLELIPVLERTGEVLNRVDRAAFFEKFQEQAAVQYFYEPFLQAFDPELRKQLGVWYTPREVVQYMVARVDTVLREELNLPRGLADPNVVVLDPCCGTGAYLVEVLRKIETTLREEGGDALVASDLRKAAMERIFGFEILPAPFVVAHLQLGLLLQQLGAALPDNPDARVGVFLTNALTGWDPDAPHGTLPFAELAMERDRANAVKQSSPILVVIGNPPYNAFAGVASEEEGDLVALYKQELASRWGVRKFNLDELYIRFFRIAERRIAEISRRGVVSLISNFSYLTGSSFVVFRERLSSSFDAMWFDCLNGDSRETGKIAPDGSPDPSIFSTPSNREGIRVGTAVATMVCKSGDDDKSTVWAREFWGVRKREQLLEAVRDPASHPYTALEPKVANKFAFRLGASETSPSGWPLVTELAKIPPFNGLMEKRSGALVDIAHAALAERMRAYLDPAIDWDAYSSRYDYLVRPMARFDPEAARRKVRGAETYSTERIIRYCLRPFDGRWAYYSPVRPLWNEPRPAYVAHVWPGNSYTVTRPAQVAAPEGSPVWATSALGDNDALRGHAYYFPALLRRSALSQLAYFQAPAALDVDANLSARVRHYLKRVLAHELDQCAAAHLVWDHVLAVVSSSRYLAANAEALILDWPRIPLPASKEALERSAALGAELRQLLDPEVQVTDAPVSGYPDRFRGLGVLTAADGGQLDSSGGDLAVTAGWGTRGKGGITMPGRGELTDHGESVDVVLNDRARWTNVPKTVYEYTLGGYQVIKKWLSYREKALLGRDLTEEEARYVTEMVRRIAAIISLGPTLDASYEAVKADVWEWGEGDAVRPLLKSATEGHARRTI